MFKLFISFTMIFLSFFMFFTNHPLMMGLLILTQTVLMSFLMGMYISTYWFSYMLFLIFLGGLLILFIYMASIASNELMKSTKLLKFTFFYLSMMLILIFFYKNYTFNEYFNNNEMNNFFQSSLFLNNYKISLSKLYDKQTFLLTMMLIIYLFITLIAVIKITNIFFGPLRSFN